MTLAEIREACKREFALPASQNDSFLTDDGWDAAINRGYRWLAFHAPLISGLWSINAALSTREYSLAALDPGVAVIDYVMFKLQGTDFQRVGLIDFTRTSQLSNFYAQTGAPSAYYVRGNSLGFYPMPDATNSGVNFIQIWGWAFPALLEADGDEPEDLNTYQQDFLIDPALYFAAKQVFNRPAGKMPASQFQLYAAARKQALIDIRATVEQRTTEAEFINTSLGFGGTSYDWGS